MSAIQSAVVMLGIGGTILLGILALLNAGWSITDEYERL